MPAIFLPKQTTELTEATSLAMTQALRQSAIMTPLLDRPIPTSFVQAGSTGMPILLLHGFDSSVLEFRRLFPLLAMGQETWAVDMVGFGFTTRLRGIPYSPQAIQTHLFCFWQQMIQRPMVLVGTSMGGAAAIDFTLAYPQCVAKLILIDSVGYTSGVPSFVRYLFPPFDYLAVDFLRSMKVRQRVSELSYHNPQLASADAALCGSLHLALPEWHRANITFMKSGGYNFLGDRIPQIQADTLILWGKADRILDPDHARRFHEALPKSQLIWIEESGHVPHLEQPQITAQKILAFSSS